jgi:hypothetical protein
MSKFKLNKELGEQINNNKVDIVTYDGIGLSFTDEVGIEAPGLPVGKQAVFSVKYADKKQGEAYTGLYVVSATEIEVR